MNWNKLTKRAGALALCTALTVGTFTLSAGAVGVTAQLSPNVSIVVDGAARTFYNVSGAEVHPITYNGTTYLPIRAIGEIMGKNVNWDQATLTVSLSGTRTTGTVSGTPDTWTATQNITGDIRSDVTILVDGVRQTFTDVNGSVVYPMIYNGSVYLPIRAIGNLMGKSVSWNQATNTVILGSGSTGTSQSSGLLVTDADSFNNTGATTQQPVQTTPPVQTQQPVQITPPVQTQQPVQITPPTQTTTSNGMISSEQAKNAALAHAGLSAGQVSFVRSHLDWDDGRQVYDVEFYTSDYKEYDYEIDAYTGAILSFDADAEYYSYTQPSTNTGSYIGEARARSIALSYVSGATDANVRYARLDWDDGRMEYEVEIIYGTMEYDFEIDAYTGAVISRDMDSIYD